MAMDDLGAGELPPTQERTPRPAAQRLLWQDLLGPPLLPHPQRLRWQEEEAVAAPVAGVKVEGNAGEVDGTGAWCRCCADGCSAGRWGCSCRGSEEKVQVGAGGLQGEADMKPFLAGDVAAPAVASQAVEAASSASPEPTVAELNENEERDNGVAQYDNEIQNNKPGHVVGISEIHEANVTPAVDQLNDNLDVFHQVEEHVPDSGTIPSSNESQLKPFVTNYSQMEKQSSSEQKKA